MNSNFKAAIDGLTVEVDAMDAGHIGRLLTTQNGRLDAIDRLEVQNANEERLQGAITASVKEWIKSGTKIVSDDLATNLLLYARFSVALGFARHIQDFGFECPDKSKDEILNWLLVDVWTEYGVHRLRSNFHYWNAKGGR